MDSLQSSLTREIAQSDVCRKFCQPIILSQSVRSLEDRWL